MRSTTSRTFCGTGIFLSPLQQRHADKQLNERLSEWQLLGSGAANDGGGLHHAVGVAEPPVMPLNKVIDSRVFQCAKEV